MKHVQIWLFCLTVLIVPAQAQGLPGTEHQNPSPRGGISAGGPLLPGKNDAERWAVLIKNEANLIGMSRKEVVRIFGKGGTPQREDSPLLYQITAAKAKGTGKLAYQELRIEITNEVVSEYSVVGIWH